MVLKSKPKLSLKFILKRCKTYKIMKGSKNNKGINPSKSYIIKIYCKKYYFWPSYWHIKCKISWERTFKRLYNWDIYRIDSFLLRFSKEVQKEPTELFYKKIVLKIISWRPATLLKRAPCLQNTSKQLLLEAESENISQSWLIYSCNIEELFPTHKILLYIKQFFFLWLKKFTKCFFFSKLSFITHLWHWMETRPSIRIILKA